MRHYFGYDNTGTLRSVETYGPAGWPNDKCLADPECLAESVVSLRESRGKRDPDIVNWVLFDCPCDAGQGDLLKNCKCVSPKFAESYVDLDTKTILPKPNRTVYIDGEVVQNGGVVTRAPGTAVDLKVVSAGMADDTELTCVQGGMADVSMDDQWTLTFTGGETDTKTLVTPSQGNKGSISISGPKFRGIIVWLRGFTAP